MISGLEERGVSQAALGLVKATESIGLTNVRMEPSDIRLQLEEVQRKWRDTLIPGSNIHEGRVVEVGKGVYVVLAGETAVTVREGSNEQWIDLLIPMRDNLTLINGGDECIFTLAERKKGGCQIEVRRVGGV